MFPKVRTWTLHRAAETVEVEVGGRFAVNDVGMCRRLATLDLGVILLPGAVAPPAFRAAVSSER